MVTITARPDATDKEKQMGDKNPKSKTKQAAQKNAKSNAASQVKQAAITAKQVPGKK
jgi:hypothetical protein